MRNTGPLKKVVMITVRGRHSMTPDSKEARVETLECGHELEFKCSAVLAQRRRCKECKP